MALLRIRRSTGAGIRVKAVGRLELLPPSTVAAIRRAEEATTAYGALTLTIAIAYGGREEIADAVRDLVRDKARHGADFNAIVEEITPSAIDNHLYTAGLPDPDLIIRTSGEIRLSGFLLVAERPQRVLLFRCQLAGVSQNRLSPGSPRFSAAATTVRALSGKPLATPAATVSVRLRPPAGYEILRTNAMTHYVGVLDGNGDVWGVRIPDIPGCVGGGASAEKAIADASEALRGVAVHKREGGFALPRPSTLAGILASGKIGEGESAVMIPLLLDSGRTVRANISLDAALLEATDAAAKQRALSRSAFLASAAREEIIAGA